ncbi:hypothetical protein BD770DRAFT_117554 [Pilaira anomala]|nr:hypothetical protein BD770DRAFT_117554 [Pilaira anomala]
MNKGNTFFFCYNPSLLYFISSILKNNNVTMIVTSDNDQVNFTFEMLISFIPTILIKLVLYSKLKLNEDQDIREII